MHTFISKSIGLRRRQHNIGSATQVFPLLCPVREADWIDGWTYDLIFSVSGLAEKGCVFTTPATGEKKTTWYITKHDAVLFKVAFVRITPGEMVVAIDIQLTDNGDGTTTSDIMYEYTAMSEGANKWIDSDAVTVFNANMDYWEQAINHYLITGAKLMRGPVMN